MRDVYEVLLERGFIQQCSNESGLRKAFQEGPVTFYIGFDPTGTSLHVGHLLQLMVMAHLQRAGHRPIALIGGGTARIGDPSGKSEMRKMLTVDDIKANAQSFQGLNLTFQNIRWKPVVGNSMAKHAARFAFPIKKADAVTQRTEIICRCTTSRT